MNICFQTLFISGIFVLNLLREIKSVDFKKTIDLDINGFMFVRNKLIYVDMFYRKLTWRSGCDQVTYGTNDSSIYCDLETTSVLMIYKSSSQIPLNSLGDYFTFDKVTSKYSTDVNKKYATYFQISDVVVNQLKIDSNIYQSTTTDVRYLSSEVYSVYYPFIYTETVISDRGYSNFPLATLIILRKANFATTGITKLSVIETVPLIQSVCKVDTEIHLKCQVNFYGSTCWYKCQNDIRKNCNCMQKLSSEVVQCQPFCKHGWSSYIIKYNLKERNGDIKTIYLDDCSYKDFCFKAQIDVCKTKQCFQFDNLSYQCVDIFPQITSNLYSENITGDVLFYMEHVRISFNTTTVTQNELKSDYSVSLIRHDPIFTKFVAQYIDGSILPNFKITSSEEVDVYFKLHIIIKFPKYHVAVERTKDIRILVYPQQIWLFNLNNNSKVKKYIYLGQKIRCESDSKPYYRTLIFFSTNLIFKPNIKFGEEHTIDTNNDMKAYEVTCQIYFVTLDRDYPKAKNKFYISLRPYEYLLWNTSDNIIDEYTVIACITKTYVDYELKLTQIEGSDSIDTLKSSISLIGIDGGPYTLLCIWKKDNLVIIKTLKFQLRKRATNICLLLFPVIPGGLIQCAHNGFLFDEWEITLQITLRDETSTVITGHEIARIPYHTTVNSISVQCIVKSEIYSLTKSNKEYYELKRTYEQTYTLTDSFKLCAQYSRYYEPFENPKITSTSITIQHKLFYFENDGIKSETIVIIFIFITFSALIAISIGYMFLLNHCSNKNSSYFNISQLAITNKYRKINDNLMHIASNILASPDTSLFKMKSFNFGTTTMNRLTGKFGNSDTSEISFKPEPGIKLGPSIKPEPSIKPKPSINP